MGGLGSGSRRHSRVRGVQLAIGVGLICCEAAFAQVQRVLYEAGGCYLHVEVLDDDLVHFEAAVGAAPPVAQAILTTPMVYRTDYSGPSYWHDDGAGVLETAALRLQIDPATLCGTVTDLTLAPPGELTTFCPTALDQTLKVLTLAPGAIANVYGLGEQFRQPGQPDGDWVGAQRRPGNAFGNAPVGFNNGWVGNAQFPVMYAVGAAHVNYALFLDDVYAQWWYFTETPWQVRTRAGALRWYVLAGPDLPDLRADFMELVGRPPVPPRKMFGLWVSEYGYDDWGELEDKLATLRSHGFPVDGFLLDLQWYGGITAYSPYSQMGSLAWDVAHFPDPAQRIAALATDDGVGVMTIEESYVCEALPEYAALAAAGALVRECATCGPIHLSEWWGAGGMLDWTDATAADTWHDWKRQPLLAQGVLGHWIDLGEPEDFVPFGWYCGFPELGLHEHVHVHNVYNLRWLESVARGYARNGVARRPFMLSRSGTVGVQRCGAALWSGDIASNLTSLAAHLNVQMHMSLSGVDYFGADIGGFLRNAVDGDPDEMYTLWFAHGMALDVPGRPHTNNTLNNYETAPDRVGDRPSNRANLQQRYRLAPYLYSLAHRGHLFGEPVFPPLVFYYQDDPAVRQIGHQKLIGRDLLVATVTQYAQTTRDMYLPAGRWANYHTCAWHDSAGAWLSAVPLYANGLFRLPLFVRAGALVPEMHVDAQTWNSTGRRADGSVRDELIVRAFADPVASTFTLYEDDGETTAYLQGALRTTPLGQQQVGYIATVTIGPAVGSYAGAPTARNNVVVLVAGPAEIAATVSVNGAALPEAASVMEFEAAASAWYNAGHNTIYAKSGTQPVTLMKTFVFDLFTDCNTNGIDDTVEIVGGTSADCDTNGVPDECQPDCNGNGVADPCDISTGTATDVNGNGVPDACEGLGDLDGDGDVDLADVAVLEGCVSGPGGGCAGGCAPADIDADGDIDLADYQGFQQLMFRL